MANHPCPFLGSLDADRNRGPCVEYPSFENHCWAVFGTEADNGDALMLSDQATFCLSASYGLCPRFVAAQASAPSGYAQPHPPGAAPFPEGQLDEDAFASDWLNADLEELERELEDLDEDAAGQRRMWSWFSAIALFLTVFAMGSLLALYAGWRYVNNDSGGNSAGGIETLAAAQAGQPPPVYIVLTATNTPASLTPMPTATPTPGAVLVAPAPTFPPAVTATPGGNDGVIVVDPQQPVAPPPLPTQPPVQALPTATPVFDFQQPVPVAPTRRPTPEFVIPTSTPIPPELLATATPTLGPPLVLFTPEEKALKPGKCTVVHWTVENVSAVYYEGLGVNGEGQKEECIDDKSEVYTLVVVLPGGASETYTTTVAVLEPTPTPTFTPTFTPEPHYTPTWTPVATPTPDLTFGADIGVEGSTQQQCPAGQACEITLVATNLSNHTDNIAVILESGGQWTGQLCRYDGVCSNSTVVVNNMAPYNNGNVLFRVLIPNDVQGQSAQYTFVAASGSSGNAVRSEPVTVTITVQ